ncbi:MAG TPA: hypothetical protein VK875_00595 [Euzebyales bacterium]|nr:hypothetical protein [Euzebyales bacterium]
MQLGDPVRRYFASALTVTAAANATVSHSPYADNQASTGARNAPSRRPDET